MLQSLRIQNLALLESVSVDFEPGFTAVTGETGAGKSILIGALSLLAGERADKAVIRQGAASCEVEASLHFSGFGRRWTPFSPSWTCRRARTASSSSSGRSHANGRPRSRSMGAWRPSPPCSGSASGGSTSTGRASPAGSSRTPASSSCSTCSAATVRRSRPTARSTGRGATSRPRARALCLRGGEAFCPDELAFMEAQLAKLDRLDLSEEAIAALERDFQRMSRSQEIISLASSIENGLSGDDGATAQVAALVREARRLEAVDPASRALADRMASASAELGELASEFGSLGRDLQADPEGMGPLEERMNSWLEARRRHGPDVRSVAAAREAMRLRVSSQGDIEGTLERLDRQIEAAAREARQSAAVLRALREKAAKSLSQGRFLRDRRPRLRQGAVSDIDRRHAGPRPQRGLRLRVPLFSERRRGAPSPRQDRLQRRARPGDAGSEGGPRRPRLGAGARLRRGGRQRRRRDWKCCGRAHGRDRAAPPGALRHPSAAGRGARGQPPRRGEGPVGRPRARHNRAHPWRPKNQGGRTRPDARRSECEERHSPRREASSRRLRPSASPGISIPNNNPKDICQNM